MPFDLNSIVSARSTYRPQRFILYGVQGDASSLTSAALWPTLGAVAAGRAIQVEDDPFYLNAGPTAARFVLDTVSTTVK